LILFPLPLCAQTPTWTLDGPAFSASASDLLTAAAAIHAEPFADATVLFEQEKYVLTADGRVTHTHQLVYRIETKAGVEDWSQTSVEWDPWYQNQPTIKARVIQPGGRVSELDLKTLTDVPAKNEEEDTFSDARIHKGPLPSTGIGAIVEEEDSVVDKLPFFAAGSVYRVFFSRPVPVVRSRVVVEVPAAAPFQFKLHSLPESAASTSEMGGIRRMVVDSNRIPVDIDSDIDLATDDIREPFVEFSTGASWSAVASAYQKLAEPQIQPDRIKSLLPATLPSDYMASVQAIVSRLHKEIRYTGIEFGESALQPQNPSEILKRHYGDCKDKAAFLVAMLRASGIPANLALLDTGPGLDVNPDLPGMNQFDHAIVYVPAGPNGHPELWIDATAEFTHVGDLPYDDEGRHALIIADGTSSLTLTPAAKPSDSVLTETREITLKQYGSAHIVETSATTGHIDADYRYRYGGAESKETKESLEKYAKRDYIAKTLTHVDHSDGSDLTKPFLLRLDMAEAARGSSSLVDAAVVIPVVDMIYTLPSWFSTDPQPGNTKLTTDQEEDRKKAEQRRASSYLVHPRTVEWRYRIAIPEGFMPRALPEDQTVHLGPATLSRKFTLEPDAKSPRMLNADFHFETGKVRYSTDEVLELRKAVLEMQRQDYLMLLFDQGGAKLLAERKPREALAFDRALIAGHPDEPLHYVQFSAALLSLGLAEQAQAEALRATVLDPKSSIAFLQLAISLEHNNIGIQYGKGFNRAAAIDAYRKAKQLEPDNVDARIHLALLYEYDAQGNRYSETANLADAVREYRELKDIDKDVYKRYEDNLLYAMLYNRQYKELLTELATLPSNATRDAIAVTATAASQSTAAAIQRADHVAGGGEQKAAAMRLAGIQLMRLNLYAQSAEMLSASIQGQQDAAQIARQAEIFRNLSHTPPATLPATDPRGPVQMMLTSMMNGTLAKAVPAFMTPHAFATDAEWKKNLEHNDVDIIGAIAKQAQLPVSVMRDVVMGNAKLTSEGDDQHGYRVTMQSLGTGNQNFFVSRDDGRFKIVAEGTDSAEVGNYALYLVANKREMEARSLLDWKRDLVHRGGGDDPLEGNLFARFWTSGSDPAANSIPIAALALTVQKPNSQTAMEPALAAYDKTPDDVDLTLLLASAYSNHRDAAKAKIYLDKLLAKYPNSMTAITMMGHVYEQTGDFAGWRAMLDSRLAKRASDHDLLVQSAYEAQAESDFGRARATLQKIVDGGKATASDYNLLAWLGLFDNHADAKSVEAAQQANSMTKNASFAELHTLACLYAAQGKTTEARELLLQAMASGYESEPNSEVWFGFGFIYEQFGANEAAIAAYRKVTKPDATPISPTATYTLAQIRLKALNATP
jgi:tetratricopeptide (TPR) repeat protein